MSPHDNAAGDDRSLLSFQTHQSNQFTDIGPLNHASYRNIMPISSRNKDFKNSRIGIFSQSLFGFGKV